jgi:hypothetical protein
MTHIFIYTSAPAAAAKAHWQDLPSQAMFAIDVVPRESYYMLLPLAGPLELVSLLAILQHL